MSKYLKGWRMVRRSIDFAPAYVVMDARTTTHLAYVDEGPGLGDDAAKVLALIEAAPKLLDALDMLMRSDVVITDTPNEVLMEAAADTADDQVTKEARKQALAVLYARSVMADLKTKGIEP